MALPIGIFLAQSFRSYTETIVVDPALNDMFWVAFAYASLAALPAMERARRRTSAPTRPFAAVRVPRSASPGESTSMR
jgi:hypothetical protein